jgi:hypothetical protein
MPYFGGQIALEVRDQINDTGVSGQFRWSDDELMRYLNAAVRQIVTLVPESNATESLLTLDQAARQRIPADGAKFIKATNNYDPVGDVRTRALRYVEKDALDTHNPDWEFSVPVPAPNPAHYFQHYTHDPREPQVFYVYPRPQSAAQKLYVVYSKVPAAITLGTQFPLPDTYVNAAIDYVIYRALTKEGRFTLPDTKAQLLWDGFLRSLGLKLEANRRVSPDVYRPPEGA